MNHRPLDSLKPLAEELADLIASRHRDEARINELAEELGLSPRGKSTRIDIGPARDASAEIGIWRKEIEAGKAVYKRDTSKRAYWHEWADTDVIYSKGTRRRILLFGESVARGHFYDPYYTVAKELEAIFNGIPECGDIEVIDLAGTGLSFTELLELCRSSVALEPDAAIIFAGNNWKRNILSSLNDHNYSSIVQTFGELGLKGIGHFLESRAEQLVMELLGTIEDTFVRRGIPIVFVIPEFNLKDWKSDDKENALGWLPEGCTEKWVESKDDAVAAIMTKDIGRLGAASTKMVALFPSNPMSHELLGVFHSLNGDHRKARACFECSRDAVILSGTSFSRPRCYRMIRDQLLQQADKRGIEVCDLASIFEGALPERIPGRREFLDYCHLTVEGIKIAMRYTAQKVLKSLNGKNIGIDSIPASKLSPDRHVSAIAHFSAAIHNAHSGQPDEILQYHCRMAIQYSSKVKEVMLKFVDFSTRRATCYFCASYAELVLGNEMYQYEGGRPLRNWPGSRLMDIPLVDAIVSSLGPVVPGIEDEVGRLRKSEHGITVQGFDLLESFYSRMHYNRYLDERDNGLYLARTLESAFYFVSSRHCGRLLFILSCRLPGMNASKRLIRIQLNDYNHFVSELPTSGDWVTHSFAVEGKYLVDGVNKLIIKWPFVHRAMTNDIPTNSESILRTIFPVIGEISSFVVRQC